MKRLAAFVVLALAALLAVLPGCSEPPRGVVVWHPYTGGEELAIKEVAARWQKEHGTRVTLLAVPYEAYLSKLEAAIPRGNGPDLFLGPHNRLGEYLLHALVAPAGDAFPGSDVAAYDGASVDAITHDGERWAVPLSMKCAALYVNPSLMPEPPRTLEELVRAKATLPAGVWPLAYESENVYYHAALLHAFGGTFFSADEGFAMIGPEAERSVDEARELTSRGIVPQEPSGDLVKQLFAKGKAATAISGPWLAADLKDGTYRVVPLPRVEGAGEMRPYLTVEAAFLTPDGAKSADARALARYLGSSDEAARILAETGKEVVAKKSFWSSPAAAAPSMRVLRAFREASARAIPMPVSVAMNPAWDPAKQAIRKVIRGDASARDALAEAKARYDDVMRPPPEAPSPAPLAIVLGLATLALALVAVRRARAPGFRRELEKSKPAYRYVAHAAITIAILVVLPLVAGAATSFFAGNEDAPRFVGLSNYVQILTARGKPLLSHGSFYLTLVVTVVWTVVNVALHVGIGLVLGVMLARPFLRMRAIYRVILILPWAVPSYVTALAWKGMFHRQFGAVNAVLSSLGAEPVSWFSKFSTAFTANVATNVWLGFPFMMVVVMGALTSIPKDVLEAAEVDGATRWQAFRLVTLPLLRPTLLPAVVLGSVWTFNMFNVVFLVSGGEPDGTTDILVSEAYRWAFTRNSQLGYAAAYAVIIFGLLALMTRALGRTGGEDKA
jgi:arabinogalactan oligomer/maltooligosaccharide transport system permease protein